jgi:hypothetical protein
MTNENGYIKLPRELIHDHILCEMPMAYWRVLMVMISVAAYTPQTFNDNGKSIDLLPGQLCISIRKLADLCGSGITRHQVDSCIKLLVKLKVVGQDVGHRKNVITIKHKATYDLIVKQDRTSHRTSHRTSIGHKEETNKSSLHSDISKKKKINKKERPESELAAWAFDRYRSVVPNAKTPDWAAWDSAYTGIITEDGKSEDDVKRVVDWIVSIWTNQFCPQAALRHPSRMRENFEDYLGRCSKRQSLRPEGFASYSDNNKIKEMAATINIIEAVT